MKDLKDTVLLLLGHGSSKHPDSSRSVRMHARVLAEKETFSSVQVAFLKEQPMVADAMAGLAEEQVLIIPDFFAQGYFTQKVIPDLLAMEGRPDSVIYASPVGVHPGMSALMESVAGTMLEDWPADEVSVLFVGHGSTKNAQSKQSLLDHIDRLRDRSDYAQIEDLWLEEPPYVNQWTTVASESKVLVIPFLLADGQHGAWDIPEMLGLEQGLGIYRETHQVSGKQLRLSHALGGSPKVADIILDMARSYHRGEE